MALNRNSSPAQRANLHVCSALSGAHATTDFAEANYVIPPRSRNFFTPRFGAPPQ